MSLHCRMQLPIRYSSCTSRNSENISCSRRRLLRKKERQDETQFTTKIDGKTNLGHSYRQIFNSHLFLVKFNAADLQALRTRQARPGCEFNQKKV